MIIHFRGPKPGGKVEPSGRAVRGLRLDSRRPSGVTCLA
jgi:hypothetical protein